MFAGCYSGTCCFLPLFFSETSASVDDKVTATSVECVLLTACFQCIEPTQSHVIICDIMECVFFKMLSLTQHDSF